MSFGKIVGQLNIHLYNVLYIFNPFVSSGSIEKIKISERGERIVYRAVKN